jgi:hypothetical protein
MHVKSKYLFVGLIVTLSLTTAFSQNGDATTSINTSSYINLTKLDVFYSNSVMQDPEFGCRDNGSQTVFRSNPIFINGQPMDISKFNLASKGILTLVKEQGGDAGSTTIPFYVSIRRNGKIIEDKKMLFLNKECLDINLSDIFSFSKQGDMLIISPARQEDWKAKRILKLFAGGC